MLYGREFFAAPIVAREAAGIEPPPPLSVKKAEAEERIRRCGRSAR